MNAPNDILKNPGTTAAAPQGDADRGARGDCDLLGAIARGEPVASEIHDEIAREDIVLEVKDFNLWYGDAQALHDVSLQVPRGQVTALIGPSGCGKSTLLRSVNRLNDLIDTVRIEGDMILNGDSIYSSGVDVIELRRRMGMVFQKSNPFPMSIADNVTYALQIDGERNRGVLRDVRAARAEAVVKASRGEIAPMPVDHPVTVRREMMERKGIPAAGSNPNLRIIDGQQQRLCIARAIAAEPEMLLMDEPCSALDPIATSRIEDLIGRLRGDYSILIVTHNMQQAARISDYTAFMYLGRLVEYGPTKEMFTNPHLSQTEDYITGRFG